MDKKDEFVWAKIPKFPLWPGKICTPKAGDKPPPTRTSKFIFFFGTKDCEWVEEKLLKPYFGTTVKVKKTAKPGVKRAINQIQAYLKDPKKFRQNAERPSDDKHNEDMETTESVNETIDESPITFGFLGLDFLGSEIVKNLSKSGHEMIIWDEDISNFKNLKANCVKVTSTPFEVLQGARTIFSRISHPLSLKELTQHVKGKGYIQMCGLENNCSQEIADAIKSNGGRYLEVLLLGSQVEARDGNLVILAAGDRNLFDECHSCFKAIGISSYFFGDVGYAMKMYLIMQSMAGITLTGLAESLHLAQKLGLRQDHVMQVLKETSIASPFIIEKGKAIVERNFAPNEPLQHMQRDLQLGLALSHSADVKMLFLASANECFKKAKQNGNSERDVTAIFEVYNNN